MDSTVVSRPKVHRYGIALALVLVVAHGLTLTTSAQAYSHSWTCERAAGNHCTDPHGTAHPWHTMTVYAGYYESFETWVYRHWCVSGKRRAGIWNFACAYGTVISGRRCDAGNVTAYTYGLEYSGRRVQSGWADLYGGC